MLAVCMAGMMEEPSSTARIHIRSHSPSRKPANPSALYSFGLNSSRVNLFKLILNFNCYFFISEIFPMHSNSAVA